MVFKNFAFAILLNFLIPLYGIYFYFWNSDEKNFYLGVMLYSVTVIVSSKWWITVFFAFVAIAQAAYLLGNLNTPFMIFRVSLVLLIAVFFVEWSYRIVYAKESPVPGLVS